jgi:Flp pilus assembly pilin Flp
MALHGWIDHIRSRSAHEEAQTMAEYGVVLGVITPVIVVGIALLADEITGVINGVISYFS